MIGGSESVTGDNYNSLLSWNGLSLPFPILIWKNNTSETVVCSSVAGLWEVHCIRGSQSSSSLGGGGIVSEMSEFI